MPLWVVSFNDSWMGVPEGMLPQYLFLYPPRIMYDYMCVCMYVCMYTVLWVPWVLRQAVGHLRQPRDPRHHTRVGTTCLRVVPVTPVDGMISDYDYDCDYDSVCRYVCSYARMYASMYVYMYACMYACCIEVASPALYMNGSITTLVLCCGLYCASRGPRSNTDGVSRRPLVQGAIPREYWGVRGSKSNPESVSWPLDVPTGSIGASFGPRSNLEGYVL